MSLTVVVYSSVWSVLFPERDSQVLHSIASLLVFLTHKHSSWFIVWFPFVFFSHLLSLTGWCSVQRMLLLLLRDRDSWDDCQGTIVSTRNEGCHRSLWRKRYESLSNKTRSLLGCVYLDIREEVNPRGYEETWDGLLFFSYGRDTSYACLSMGFQVIPVEFLTKWTGF